MCSSDTKPVRATKGVKLLNLDPDDKVASTAVIPSEDKLTTEGGTLLQ